MAVLAAFEILYSGKSTESGQAVAMDSDIHDCLQPQLGLPLLDRLRVFRQ
jgi:hypothetical protein